MGDFLKLQYELREMEQELKIRTEQNAELYAKLCNAIVQLNEANEVIKCYKNIKAFTEEEKKKTKNSEEWEARYLASQYLEKYGVEK